MAVKSNRKENSEEQKPAAVDTGTPQVTTEATTDSGPDQEPKPDEPVIEEKIPLTKEQEVNLSPALVQRLLDEVATLKEKVNTRTASGEFKDILDADEVPLDDYLEIPVVFFAYAHYYSIHDDKRKGRNVRTPFNRPFRFQRASRFTRPVKNGKETTIITVSQVLVRSKRELEWLRGHTKLGIKFYEKRSDLDSIDVEYAERLNQVHQMIGSMDNHAIIERARLYEDIVLDSDIQLVRKQLVDKMARQLMEQDKLRTEKTVRNSSDQTKTANSEEAPTTGDPYS